jgi:RNA polymerase sigma-70 factor (ECF subfamily)
VHLNRAVAIAMRDGPEAGLAHIDAVFGTRRIGKLLPGAFRAGRYVPQAGEDHTEARASYEKALALTQQEPERQFLQARIRQLK